MKIFMLGWEFPPHISGGLGTACYGLTRGLDEVGVEVNFVLPVSVPSSDGGHVTLKTAEDLPDGVHRIVQQVKETKQLSKRVRKKSKPFKHVRMYQVDALLRPYGEDISVEQAYTEIFEEEAESTAEVQDIEEKVAQAISSVETSLGLFSPEEQSGANYEGDMMEQVRQYERLAVALSLMEDFDVIHAHDWMTYPAALHVQKLTGKPLVVHVHSTEFDRSGDNINQQVYDIERAGMHGADAVVCVSYLTRNIAAWRYGIATDKIHVVYNAVELPDNSSVTVSPIKKNEKIVLFLGRITMQKGPEYFLMAAKKVVEKFSDVRFVMAGSGDMITRMIRMAADLGIGKNVTFTGFLRGDDVDRMFSMADLYVMPSVSEPFGIAPLEALSHDVPVLISKQSGVSEVITHALKVNFWDVDEMADKILAVLTRPPLGTALREHGKFELSRLSWTQSAEELNKIYGQLVREND